MNASTYTVHVAPLVGPERTSFYEVVLRPTEPRAAGEVSREVVRILIRDDPDAELIQVITKARTLLEAVAAAEWWNIGS